MSNENGQTQFAEAAKAVKTLSDEAYQKYPINSAFPIGCEERAEFISRGMVAIKKRFPKAFK